MRVLYLTDRIGARSGADHHLLQVVEWARDRGHEVAVAAARVDRIGLPPGDLDTERIRCLGSRLQSSSGLDRVLARLAGADLVHLQNVMNPTVLAAAVATGRAVVTVQDHRIFCPGPGRTLPDGSACSAVMSELACSSCLPDADYRAMMLDATTARRDAVRGATLVALSSYMRLELEAAGLPGAAVVPPWFEVSRGEPDAGSGFLLAGRLVTHKAPIDGWRAWRRADCGMPLRVAGAGPMEGELVGAERLGWLAPQELARELRRSRALLFPNRWQEPFGMVGVEALARATPVIVARTGGVAEWSHRGCLVVDPGDVTAMADAIRDLASDPRLAVRLGLDGRDMVAERFSRSEVEARLTELYRGVEARSGGAG